MNSSEFFLFLMVFVIGVCVALLGMFAATCEAAELRAGKDIHHSGAPSVSVAFHDTWTTTQIGYIGESELRHRTEPDLFFFGHSFRYDTRDWAFRLGGVYVTEETKMMGTNFGFDIGIRYKITPSISMGLTHISNGEGVHKVLFDKGHCECSNRGFNILQLGYKF